MEVQSGIDQCIEPDSLDLNEDRSLFNDSLSQSKINESSQVVEKMLDDSLNFIEETMTNKDLKITNNKALSSSQTSNSSSSSAPLSSQGTQAKSNLVVLVPKITPQFGKKQTSKTPQPTLSKGVSSPTDNFEEKIKPSFATKKSKLKKEKTASLRDTSGFTFKEDHHGTEQLAEEEEKICKEFVKEEKKFLKEFGKRNNKKQHKTERVSKTDHQETNLKRKEKKKTNNRKKKTTSKCTVTVEHISTTHTSSQSSSVASNSQSYITTTDSNSAGTFKLWVQCDHPGCLKWRLLTDITDPLQVPDKWYCSMNKDTKRNTCDAEEEVWSEPEDNYEYIYSDYVPGSVVLAKLDGFPWWPAMIEPDPDEECYYKTDDDRSSIPTCYHVVFFDTPVSRSWIHTLNITPFTISTSLKHCGSQINVKHRDGLHHALSEAHAALKLSHGDRLENWGFRPRFNGIRKRKSDKSMNLQLKKFKKSKELIDKENCPELQN